MAQLHVKHNGLPFNGHRDLQLHQRFSTEIIFSLLLTVFIPLLRFLYRIRPLYYINGAVYTISTVGVLQLPIAIACCPFLCLILVIIVFIYNRRINTVRQIPRRSNRPYSQGMQSVDRSHVVRVIGYGGNEYYYQSQLLQQQPFLSTSSSGDEEPYYDAVVQQLDEEIGQNESESARRENPLSYNCEEERLMQPLYTCSTVPEVDEDDVDQLHVVDEAATESVKNSEGDKNGSNNSTDCRTPAAAGDPQDDGPEVKRCTSAPPKLFLYCRRAGGRRRNTSAHNNSSSGAAGKILPAPGFSLSAVVSPPPLIPPGMRPRPEIQIPEATSDHADDNTTLDFESRCSAFISTKRCQIQCDHLSDAIQRTLGSSQSYINSTGFPRSPLMSPRTSASNSIITTPRRYPRSISAAARPNSAHIMGRLRRLLSSAS